MPRQPASPPRLVLLPQPTNRRKLGRPSGARRAEAPEGLEDARHVSLTMHHPRGLVEVEGPLAGLVELAAATLATSRLADRVVERLDPRRGRETP